MRKRRWRGPENIAAFLPAVTKAARGPRGFAAAEVIAHWPAIVGEALARQCSPEKLSMSGRAGGVLRVRAPGSLALELQHLEPQVIDRINAYLGYRAVGRLAFTQAPVPERKRAPAAVDPPLAPAALVAGAVSGIVVPGLRRSLIGLGRRVAAAPARGREGRGRSPKSP